MAAEMYTAAPEYRPAPSRWQIIKYGVLRPLDKEMTFSLRFKNETDLDAVGKPEIREGLLRIGEDERVFVAEIFLLSQRGYMRQWMAAISRILAGGQRSAFLENYSPGEGYEIFGRWTGVYRLGKGDDLAIHEMLILPHVVGQDFGITNCLDRVPLYTERDPDTGMFILEWYTTTSELKAFQRELMAKL